MQKRLRIQGGFFIATEGLDGAGNSSHAEELYKKLSKDYHFILTKEPTINLLGGIIRAALRKEWKTPPKALQMLFCSDRYHHAEYEIVPALSKNFGVIADRYDGSTIAFGAIDESTDDFDWYVNLCSKFPEPDLYFYLDAPAETCIDRLDNSRVDIELVEESEKLKQVRENYLKLAKIRKNFYVIDNTRDFNVVNSELEKIARKAIKARIVA